MKYLIKKDSTYYKTFWNGKGFKKKDIVLLLDENLVHKRYNYTTSTCYRFYCLRRQRVIKVVTRIDIDKSFWRISGDPR